MTRAERGTPRPANVLTVHRRSRGAFALWVLLYTLLALLPLPLALIRLDPGRGFWINLSVALGFVGLAMFGLQFVMAARSAMIVHPVGMDLVLGFHRQMAYLATALVFAHPIILLRAKFAVASCVLLLAVIALSVFRQRLRLSYEAWQATHAILAVAVVATALAHVLLVGYYVREWWEQTLWIVLSAAFIGLGVWVRLIKPVLRRRHPWQVESIEHDVDDVTTITIGSVDARPFRFDPGQFAWLQARRSPFAITYHPFSISSSAERPGRISFSIKAHERFSRDVAGLRPGDRMYVDGPFGAFVLPESGPIVGIGAGVGVTPLLSMFETLADRGDTRPVQLWLGNRAETTISCLAQITALQQRLDLEVVHVLSRPSAAWQGVTGHIDATFLRSHLPTAATGSTFCICGPDALMDAVEKVLAAEGVRPDAIRSERFGMV
jgi:predicted ferric reductase